MRFVKHFWGLFLTVILITFFHNSWSVLPPLGKLFSPFEGYLQNTKSGFSERDEALDIPGLREKVLVKYDDNGVPHIFAKNDHDLYLAQGYVVAKDRLWQMEFYTLVSAGRLTEVVGSSALEYDRYNRKLGMANAARQIMENLESDSISSLILDAYAAGVNAYIESMAGRELPLEYKILNYKPEKWSPYKSILMLMNMRNSLSGGSNDWRLSNVVSQYGIDITNDLFPTYPTVESPIIPVGTKWGFDPASVPAVPDTVMAVVPAQLISMNVPEPQPEIGSNNWAVAGSKSATGLPLLSNDPHLQLTLPSIWYQIQLAAPGVNVCGVSLPGSPAVIIGFNKDVAWGVTNVGSDVMDFYKISFEDERKKRYLHDGSWKEVETRVETFKLKGGKEVIDTLRLTHHGPIIYEEAGKSRFNKSIPVGHAMRWVANETDGAEVKALHLLNRAKNYDDYRYAIQYFTAPAQNFIFSSNQNDIAITSNGKLPLKWKEQGRYILDGSMASHDWQGWIPNAHNPSVKNPPRGFVSSANQFPTDPTYPYYLDWRFAHSSRAIRINERLAEMKAVNVDSLNKLLNDNFNVDARTILPRLLQALAADAEISSADEYKVLADWDYYNDANAVAASIYENWQTALLKAIWEDDFPAADGFLYPSRDRTWALIAQDPDASWFDDRTTPDQQETLDDLIVSSYKQTVTEMTDKYGAFDSEKWAWSNVKATRIAHLVPNFTSFSRFDIPNGGGSNAVNATSATHGPSWRMIVQLDESWPKAFGIYPGGQSGNPGSDYYDNMIDKWVRGELNPLLYLKDESELSSLLTHELTLKPVAEKQ